MANELSNLKPAPGSTRERTRVGRGEGSGKGKTAGRGTKGQKARSGYTWRPGFEGGQMPLHRRLPKRGFRNKFKKEFTVLNVERLADLPEGTVVTEEFLDDNGLIAKIGKNGVKILGMGDLEVALHVRVSKLSKSAAEKITAAGGTIEGPVPE